MQARYQYGNLTLRKRKKGPDVWQFRWMENGNPNSVLIGTAEKYATKADAERAVESLRSRVKGGNLQQAFHSVTVGSLVDRYTSEELPTRYSTRISYLSILNRHILPRWRDVHLGAVRALEVESWLRSPNLAPKTKAHLRGLMHILFQCAQRWEFISNNPIDLVRQSARRRAVPRVLTPAEFCALVTNLKQPYRLMVLVAGCLGLRASEVIGLQWHDFDWGALTVVIRRELFMAESEKPKPRPLTNRFHSIPVSRRRSWRIASDRCMFNRPTTCSREIPASRVGKRQFSPTTSS